MGIRGFILAAGASLRMGEPKALLNIQCETLIARTIRIVSEATATKPIVVIGASPVIADACDGAEVVMNPDWQQGPGTSIRAGVAACKADAVMIMACDLPRITVEDLRRLIDALAPPATASAASFDGTIGPPACFDRSWFERLLTHDPAHGMKQHLLHAGNEVARVAMPNASFDVDTPEAFKAIQTM